MASEKSRYSAGSVCRSIANPLTLTLSALERTFLAYFRTSLAFSFLGVLVTQLFRIQSPLDPNPNLGFRKIGIPLACVCHVFAILTQVVGARRWWRQQCAMARGKVYCGGWELNSVGAFTGVVSCLVPDIPFFCSVYTGVDWNRELYYFCRPVSTQILLTGSTVT